MRSEVGDKWLISGSAVASPPLFLHIPLGSIVCDRWAECWNVHANEMSTVVVSVSQKDASCHGRESNSCRPTGGQAGRRHPTLTLPQQLLSLSLSAVCPHPTPTAILCMASPRLNPIPPQAHTRQRALHCTPSWQPLSLSACHAPDSQSEDC